MGIVSEKLRRSARGQPCTIGIPGVCTHDPEQTVLAHAPSDVSGMGSKGHDYHGAFACMACHMALDHHMLSKEQELACWLRGLMRTQNEWVRSGLLVIPVDPETAKRRPKRKGGIKSRGFDTSVKRKIPSRPLRATGLPVGKDGA